METLLLCHIENSDPPAFQVERAGGERTGRTIVPPPGDFLVGTKPDSDLLREFRWYTERFLDNPFSPDTERAARVLDTLHAWGEKAFLALFGPRDAAALFDAATSEGYDKLTLQVRSDDPAIFAWPWEALRDPQHSMIGSACRIERCLNHVADSVILSADLPEDRVNVLLVTASPHERDIPHRSTCRILVELIDKKHLPARVHVLRPPTLERLREHLRERPSYYHLVHFDGHAIYSDPSSERQPLAPGGNESRLVFEDDKGEPDPVPAGTLSALLRENRIPAIFLNARRSAIVDGGTVDPLVSTAGALLRAGTRSVVVMGYSLSGGGAAQFLPAFYRRFFESGRVTEAVRAGRQAMFASPSRVCVRGHYDLVDWMVPILYESHAARMCSFNAAAPSAAVKTIELPKGARDDDNPFGFIGREEKMLEIERAMRQPAPALLIQGPAGIGKTTLARGLMRWLADSDGLGEGCQWLSFREIRSAEYVFRELGRPLFGTELRTATLEQKMEDLAARLREHRWIIVWDDFEVASGGAGLPPALSEMDRQWLRTFLKRLRGGRSKVILTSHNEEAWLGPERRKVALDGLDGEARWEYCNAVVSHLQIAVDRSDKRFKDLMDFLSGHPLMMRVVLPTLATQTPSEVQRTLQTWLQPLGPGAEDNVQSKLDVTLGFVEEALPQELRPLLLPLGLHERYVDCSMLEVLVQQVDDRFTRARVDALLGALAASGLVRDAGRSLFEMHPALSAFLQWRSAETAMQTQRDRWSRAFVDMMGYVAAALAPRELHEQESVFHMYGASLYRALSEARRMGMDSDEVALTQVLGVCALNMQNLAEARVLHEDLAKLHGARENKPAEAAALQQLAMIAAQQCDFVAAEAASRRCLAIQEEQADHGGIAATYHQLAVLAESQEHWGDAGWWLIHAIAALSRSGDTEGVARSIPSLLRAYKRLSSADHAKLRDTWQDAGLGEFPSEGEADLS
jgi:hypothetical protein